MGYNEPDDLEDVVPRPGYELQPQVVFCSASETFVHPIPILIHKVSSTALEFLHHHLDFRQRTICAWSVYLSIPHVGMAATTSSSANATSAPIDHYPQCLSSTPFQQFWTAAGVATTSNSVKTVQHRDPIVARVSVRKSSIFELNGKSRLTRAKMQTQMIRATGTSTCA